MSITDKNLSFNHGKSYCLFGCDVLSKLLKSFEAHIDDVIENKDVECVHKMRVSSRKIRAVMSLFQSCYPKKKYKRWFKEIKTVTKLLSEARDLDVQIAFLQNYIQESPAKRQGLTPLLKDHKDCRKAVQATVTEGLEKLQNSAGLTEISDFLKRTAGELSGESLDSRSVFEKAGWNITCLLDDLLALSEYVHQESETLKHHEMRINAKHLRYTMETFAPLYKNGLTQEIQVIKDFQDLLGEMHDCDEWLSILSKFTVDNQHLGDNQKKRFKKDFITVEFKQAAIDFSVYVTERKERNYASFVKRWDEVMAQNFFSNLQKSVNTEAGFGANKLDSVLLSNPNLKVAVLSDIHANLHALETVVQDAEKKGAQLFLNAGDSVGFGACPNEVLNLLYEKNVLSVCGNFDSEVLQDTSKDKGVKKLALTYTNNVLTEPCKVYLHSFPTEMKLELVGKKVLVTHASPKSSTEHLYHDTPEARLKKIASDAEADLIIVGHSHDPFYRQAAGVSFVNPGSVGRPGDGNPQTAYAMLSFNPLNVELFRLSYPVEDAASASRKKGLPESFAQMLLRGEALEAIKSEDKAKKANQNRNWTELMYAARELSKTCLQDTMHVEHVRELSLSLYDTLQSLHHLGEYQRNLLECAALLHDLGLSKAIKGHNKTSMTIILNEAQLPLASEERRVVASIARYHRKGLPKQKHYNLATLNSKTVNEISALSSILRVADSLDYTHDAKVKILGVRVASKRVTLECVSDTDTSLVEQAFDKKKDLFEKFFKKKMVLVWVKQ